jgi:hypothetical protein
VRGSDHQAVAFKYRQRYIEGLAGSLGSVIGAWYSVTHRVEETTDARAAANETGEIAGRQVIDELKRSGNVVLVNTLSDPRMAVGNGETKKNRSLVVALGNDGKGIPKILKDVLPWSKSNLPLTE